MTLRWVIVLTLLTGCGGNKDWVETELNRGWKLYEHRAYCEAEKVFDHLAGSRPDAALLIKIEQYRLITLSKLKDPRAEYSASFLERYIANEADPEKRAKPLNTVAGVLLVSNRFEEATRRLEPSVKDFGALADRGIVAQADDTLGWCYYRLGYTTKALKFFEDEEKISRETCDREHLQRSLGGIANVYFDREDYSGAARKYGLALDFARSVSNMANQAKWLSNLAACAIEQRDWDRASVYNHEAMILKKDDPDSVQYSLVNEGKIAIGRGRYAEAEEILKRVIGRKTGDSAPVLDAYGALAGLYLAKHQPKKATEAYDSAMQRIIDDSRRLNDDANRFTYIEHQININQDYVRFLMDAHKPAEALLVAERSRAAVLMERLGLAASKGVEGVAEYEKLARERNVVFLVYWVAPRESYLWFVSGTKLLSFVLPKEADLAAPDFNTLLGKVSGFLAKDARVVIVPSGPLSALNFEMLKTPSDRYWIEDATVMVAPSLNFLVQRAHAARATERSLLLMGNADEVDPSYPKLTYAPREMENARSTFANAAEYSGVRAIPEAYGNSHPERYSHIHFATHGVGGRDNPLDSAIILSNGKSGYRLPASAIANVKINAELVTLSACEGAGAKTYRGEGRVGLAWAFLKAGARGVIAGEGAVNDNSTPQLMKDLYGEIASGHTPADALRTAKLKMLHRGEYGDPKYWGVFQYYAGSL